MKEAIVHALRRYKKSVMELEGYTPSAVLVPLYLKQGKYHLLFTQRSLEVKDHKGQISFPGGRRDEEDRDLQETALRETEEELGIPRGEVEVLGELGDIYTPTRYRITPFVGTIPFPYNFQLNRREIESLIEVPLSHLMEPANLRYEHLEFFDSEQDLPYYHYKQHTIWGATGRITRELLELLKTSL